MSSGVEYRCSVSGLAWATGDQDLKNAFSQFGEVIDSNIIQQTGTSRRVGFVSFNNEKAMRDAIKVMNGKELDGHTITVNEAQARDSGGYQLRGGGGGGYTGYGGGFGHSRSGKDGGGY